MTYPNDEAAFKAYMMQNNQERRERRAKARASAPRKCRANKRRLAKSTPEIAWLRELICPLVYGEKTPDGVRPRLTKKTLIGLWNLGWPMSKLPNYRLVDHFAGTETLYYFGNGRAPDEFTLAMIDIDVLKAKRLGSPQGALDFAQHLKAIWPSLYYERSTNGKGMHAYLLLRKKGVEANDVNMALRRLEQWLRAEAKRVGADIEQVEVKGTCMEMTFDRRLLQSVHYGQFAKLPREIHRFAEWQATTILTHSDLMSSRFDVTAAPESTPTSTSRTSTLPGSVSGRVISDEELAGIPSYERLYRAWVGNTDLKAGKWSVTPHDFAVAMVLLRHFHEDPNADGSLPCRRAAELWTSLYAADDVQRPWNHHRWKAIRDFLSAKGHIEWTDNRYDFGQQAGDKAKRGIACKWTITADFALTLDRVASITARQTGVASFVDTPVHEYVSSQGTGPNLRPEPYPIRAENERKFWFRAYEVCERTWAA